MDLGDHALVGGVDDVEGLAFLALDELVVDEAGWAVSEDVQELRPPNEDVGGVVIALELHLQAGWLLVLAGVRRLKLDGSHIEVMCSCLEGVANREQWHNRVCLTMGEEREI